MTAALSGAWYVVCTEPNMELSLVWRLQQIGREVFVPLVRKRIPARGRNKAGHRIMKTKPLPMFPGYGFIRCEDATDLDEIYCREAFRGFAAFLKFPGTDRRAQISPAQMDRVLAKNYEEHTRYLSEMGARRKRPPKFSVGQQVIVDDGLMQGKIGTIENYKGTDRVEVLFDMLKVNVPVDQLRAA